MAIIARMSRLKRDRDRDTDQTHIGFKGPRWIQDTSGRLVARVAASRELNPAGHPLTRSDVYRLAMRLGLEAIARRLG